MTDSNVSNLSFFKRPQLALETEEFGRKNGERVQRLLGREPRFDGQSEILVERGRIVVSPGRENERNAGFAQWRGHLSDEPRDDVLVIGTFGERDELFTLAHEIGLSLPDRLFVNVVPAFSEGGWYCEIVPAHISKWTGVTQLARKLGIPPDAICAVGDQRNDLPMIREAALGVAMGNAAPEVKEAADLVTGRHDEDGLVAVVERILS